jgi:flagellar hook protein FlgE
MAVGSFSAGLSGLNANSVYLNVIGNNLSNINTIGFKASSVTFMDLVSQTTGGSSINPMQVGLGVVTGQMSPVFNQGAIENSGEATNAAIQGNGFFVVKGPDSGTFYTRAGNFSLDKTGALVTPDGFTVQGYMQTDPVTGAIIANGQPTNIVVPAGVLRPPVATTSIRTQTNLDATAAVGATFDSPVEVFDSLGTAHVMTTSYTRTATGWNFAIRVPGADVTPASATPVTLAAVSIAFDATGGVDTIVATAPATGGGNLPGTPITDVGFTGPAWANGASPGTITWDLVNAAGVVSLTGYSSPSATSSVSQNGAAAGKIDNISINVDGSIMATSGAGRTVAIGKLALASFNNNKGLVKMGSNRYGESESSGAPNTGSAGTGGRGTLVGAALEQSNVDMAQQFTQMILAQRGYQANSKTITVSDELLLDTLNLKR